MQRHFGVENWLFSTIDVNVALRALLCQWNKGRSGGLLWVKTATTGEAFLSWQLHWDQRLNVIDPRLCLQGGFRTWRSIAGWRHFRLQCPRFKTWNSVQNSSSIRCRNAYQEDTYLVMISIRYAQLFCFGAGPLTKGTLLCIKKATVRR